MKGSIAAKLSTVLLILLVAFAFAPAVRTMAAPKVVRITLIDENGSGEDGSAQITDNGDGTTKVELIMFNMPETVEQPAGIHKGTCATLDADVEYALENVETDGKSTTTVKVALSELLDEKYAIAVMKSAAADKTVYSCGILPTAAAASGTLTLEQSMEQLVDQAGELLATVKKQEADGSQNAYNAYHGTFASIEDQVKAKSADKQAELEEAMHGVRDALAEGNWAEAEEAATELVDLAKEAQTLMQGVPTTTTTTSATGPMAQITTATANLVREIKNKDKAGSDRAYEAFHTLFAANEADIKAKSPEAQEHIENAMHEVRDALAAGDWAKANVAVAELQQEVADATVEMAAPAESTLPKTGESTLPILFDLIAVAAILLVLGSMVRRRSNN